MGRWAVMTAAVAAAAMAGCEAGNLGDLGGSLGQFGGGAPLGGAAGSAAAGPDHGQCLYYGVALGAEGTELHRDCEVDGRASEVTVPPDWRQASFVGPVEEVPDICLAGACVDAAGGVPGWLWVEEFEAGALACETRVSEAGVCTVCLDRDGLGGRVPCAARGGGVWGYFDAASGAPAAGPAAGPAAAADGGR